MLLLCEIKVYTGYDKSSAIKVANSHAILPLVIVM